ncbi:ABC transporter ATP-binding protein [Tabrizicola sp.]|uniref:ABC transporter ATP-binding protein n=1 Tax=Tabrizicola sp. TaxID=2005166 RepID=UPI0025CE8BF9|nr:ABC transporter ATP-binding protein [Tabrizicola sp.]MBY0350241.1 ABC transporter ATP-binding protein [Tabrizicola sp.]
MAALTLSGLTKRYGGTSQAALHQLDLSIASGSLTALLGPSGSGKTTTMKLIAGLIAPDAGDIRLGGRSVRDLAPERRGVAMVFQNPLLFPHLTVAGNVGFGLRMRGLPADRIASSVALILSRVRLTGLGDRRPGQLSGGQQQRTALARALILRPDVLLLDEPLSNLDPSLRDEMRQLIRELHSETGITTLVVTHDQTEAVALADHVALLLDGRLAQAGPPETFYQRPATQAVARFFGGVNFVPGTARAGVFDSALGPLRLPAGIAEGAGLLTIRPEALRFGPGPNPLIARVEGVTFLGTQSRIDLLAGGVRLQALTDPDAASDLVRGSDVAVTLPPQALWVLPSAP